MAIDPNPADLGTRSCDSAAAQPSPLYRVAVVERPAGWQPQGLDEAPPQFTGQTTASETGDLFVAVRQAVEQNQARQPGDRHWTIVIEAHSRGRLLKSGRLCTPITYKVAAVWRPEGWEPTSPLDVPNCLWQAQGESAAEALPYAQAVQTIRSLNQQSMDWAGPMWYVLLAVEHEPVAETVAYDPAGTETTTRVRRLHVVCPESGTRGDCSHCPAHAFPCAAPGGSNQPQTVVERHVRAGSPTP